LWPFLKSPMSSNCQIPYEPAANSTVDKHENQFFKICNAIPGTGLSTTSAKPYSLVFCGYLSNNPYFPRRRKYDTVSLAGRGLQCQSIPGLAIYHYRSHEKYVGRFILFSVDNFLYTALHASPSTAQQSLSHFLWRLFLDQIAPKSTYVHPCDPKCRWLQRQS